MWATFHLHADSDPESAAGTMVELQCLHILQQRTGNPIYHDGFGIFDLCFREELLLSGSVSAIRAMAGQLLSFETRAGLNFEISFALLYGTLAANEAILVRWN
jgi:hypothetical protein